MATRANNSTPNMQNLFIVNCLSFTLWRRAVTRKTSRSICATQRARCALTASSSCLLERRTWAKRHSYARSCAVRLLRIAPAAEVIKETQDHAQANLRFNSHGNLTDLNFMSKSIFSIPCRVVAEIYHAFIYHNIFCMFII